MRAIILGAMLAGAVWCPAEMREWTSAAGGSSFSGEVVKVVGNKAMLKNAGGKTVTVPISKLSPADQEYLAAFIRKQEEERREAARKVVVPYKQGEITGPIKAGSRSSYLVYLPNTLTNEREAPLLFYTNAGGGSESVLEPLITAAEINGWILAVSMESRNNNKDDNLAVSKTAVDHLLDTLPIDDDRLYFAGHSGGAAQAFENGGAMDACGVMPNVGYIPSGTKVPDSDCFIINGGSDYNRYTSAYARKQIGETAVQRFHGGGHGKAPGWLMEDGMFWLEGRFLVQHQKKTALEQADYISGLLDWVEKNKEYEAHRAYYWAVFLRDNLPLNSGDTARVKTVIEELSADRNNALYVEGLKDLDRLSVSKLSKFGAGSLHDHSDSGVNAQCDTLLQKYSGVPVIEASLNALKQKTK